MNQETSGLSMLVRFLLFLAFAAGVIACIYLISLGKLTDREAALLGILVTILSVLASWVITEMYANSQYKMALREVKEEHRSNLRTYALKAAEKVNNLSNELNRLGTYLETELNYTDYRTTEEELLAKEERIESAIHLVRTLKSMNDAGLSDWEGVIGDELDQRREEQEEKKEQILNLVERVESLIERQRSEAAGTHKYTTSVRADIENLERQLRLAMSQLSDTSIPRHARKKEPKQLVEATCPACSEPLQYQQRALTRSVKLVPCKECSVKLVSTYSSSTGFALKPRGKELTEARCANCSVSNSIEFDNYPGSSAFPVCEGCGSPFRVIRTADGVEVKSLIAPKPSVEAGPQSLTPLTEAIIIRVQAELPPQPWPSGTHHVIAAKLEVPATTVNRAITELIRRKACHPQIDGAVYVLREEPTKAN